MGGRKDAKGPAHELVIALLVKRLVRLVPPNCHVRNQAPTTLAGSEPEPDATILRGEERDYPDRHPGAADVLIVMEVADATLATDRLKAGIYAAAGIPEYWLVNLPDRCIEVYRNPDALTRQYGDATAIEECDRVQLSVSGHSCGTIPVVNCLP